MKKPTKPPPPPPPPPKHGNVSPICSVASLSRQNCCWNGSEYAESVSSISYSTRSLQPPMRCASPAGYQTCRSESGLRVGSTLGSSSCRTCCSSIQQSQNCCCHSIACSSHSTRGCAIASLVSEHRRAPSPCGTVHSHHSHFSASNHCNHANYSPQQLSGCCDCDSCSSRPSPSNKQLLHHNQLAAHGQHGLISDHQPLSDSSRIIAEDVPIPPPHKYLLDNRVHRVDMVDASTRAAVEAETRPPIPKERIVRPRMSISPLPRLKRARDSNRRDEKESYKKCKPSQYKRHMDLHIQTIFKYLSDRESRRMNLEAKMSMDETSTVRDILMMSYRKKETDYLRSLRSRMSPDDFITITKLGQGYMGSVSLVKKNSRDGKDSHLFAMKKIKKSQVYQQNHMAHVMAERDILAEADNEWIVKLYYSFQDEQNLYFILEYLPGGDMIALLIEKGFFPEEWAKFYIAEISLAVQFVHDMGYIHRDIKPDNILIDANGHLKLTDFGLCTGFRWTHDAKYYQDDTLGATLNSAKIGSIQSGDQNRTDEHMTITRDLIKREIEHSRRPKTLSLVGSPNYIAPEVLRQACYGQQSTSGKLCDWWSVGVILYEMVVGYCPFLDLEDQNTNSPEFIQDRILRWKEFLKFRQLYDNHLKPRQLSDEIVDLIKGLICDPEDRLCQNGIGDLKLHPFFNGLDWKNIRLTEPPCKPNLKDEYDTSCFPLDNHLPELSFNPSKSHGTMACFTYKNYWSRG